MNDTASDADEFMHPVDRECYQHTWNELVDRWEQHGLPGLEALERQLKRAKEKFMKGGSPVPSTLRNGMLMKTLGDGTFGELSKVKKPSDAKEILSTTEEAIHVTERYIFAQQLGRIDARLEMTRVIIWFDIQGAEVPDWESLPEEVKNDISTPGRPRRADNNPEEIRDVLAVILEFADDYPEHDPPFRVVKEAIADRVDHLHTTSAQGAVVRAVNTMRKEYGAQEVPKPKYNVGFYAEYSTPLRKALDAFSEERFPKNFG